MKVAINGLGRIGRLCLRKLLSVPNVEVVAVNDLADSFTLAHLLKYDSVHGRFSSTVISEENALMINGKSVRVFGESSPERLPWRALGIDLVIEATGRFTGLADARRHLHAGAGKVLITAPAVGPVATIVMGVNHHILTGEEAVISTASCTTNCLAPMAKVLDEHFGIEQGFISTVHAYTAGQQLVDAPHRDLRRARAAAHSIVPTSTGAARAISLVLPQLEGKLDGVSFRVPVPDGCVTDFTVLLKREVTREAVNQAMREAAGSTLRGIIEYTEDPIVSADIIGNPHACIFDAGLTMTGGKLVKVSGWYDNEYGHASRVIDLVAHLDQLQFSTTNHYALNQSA